MAEYSGSLTSLGRRWKSEHLDGDVYAQPLVAGDRVIVATESNSIYAFDVVTGERLWRTHLGEPVDASTLPCGNIDPSGITGTPVIDPAQKIVYAVAFVAPGHHRLAALDLLDGHVMFTRTTDVKGLDPTVHQQRPALTLANGRIYVPFGGLYGDCGNYHGWVVGVPADGSGTTVSYRVPSEHRAGIWAPSGGAVDRSDNLLVATGNSDSVDGFDFGDAVVRLSPELRVTGYFAPTNWAELNSDDIDLGSVGPALLASGMAWQGGKEGVGYLFDPEDPGGIGGESFSAPVCDGGGVYGGTATSEDLLFVPCDNGLVGLGTHASSFEILWRGPEFNAGPPIVTGGTVWTLDIDDGSLHGFAIRSGEELANFTVGPVAHFAVPSAGGGCLFVPQLRNIVALCE